MPWAKINYQNYEFVKDKASEDTGGNIVSLEMSLTPNLQFEASRNFVSVSGVDDEDTYRLMYYNPPKNKTNETATQKVESITIIFISIFFR